MTNETPTPAERSVITPDEIGQWKRTIEWHPLPELGEHKGVYIRELIAAEYDAYMASIAVPDGTTDDKTKQPNMKVDQETVRLRFLARTMCIEDGTPLYKFNEFRKVGKWKPAIVTELHEHAARLNGLDAEADEELAKN